VHLLGRSGATRVGTDREMAPHETSAGVFGWWNAQEETRRRYAVWISAAPVRMHVISGTWRDAGNLHGRQPDLHRKHAA